MKFWNEAFLGVGGNIGDRLKNLVKAKFLLEQDHNIEVIKVSSIYETSPIGPKQRDFLNCVFKVRTIYSPLKLLRAVKSVEKKMKRKMTVRDGPRVIDIDILFYGKKVVKSKELSLPHPRFSGRKFVLKPLAEIASNLRPPGFTKTIHQLKNELTEKDQRVSLYAKF